jgi:hypothetical protein
MSTLQRMLESHPHPAGSDGDEARRTIEMLADCEQTCTICADACLEESDVQHMVACIRLCLDCADVCRTTGALMARPSHRDAPALQAQLEACVAMCRACANECDANAEKMEHCRICAEACRACAEECETMAGALVP